MDAVFLSKFPHGSGQRRFVELLIHWKNEGVLNINSQWDPLKAFLRRSATVQFTYDSGDFSHKILKDYISYLQSETNKEFFSPTLPPDVKKVAILAFDLKFERVLLELEDGIRIPSRGLGGNEGVLNNASKALSKTGNETIVGDARSRICPSCYVTVGALTVFLVFGMPENVAIPDGIG